MNDGVLFHNNNNILLNDVLDGDYPDISKAIKAEGYNLDFLNFDVFQEIMFENRAVGFMAFRRCPRTDNIYSITEAYIIPEFRGNNLLFENLMDLLTFDNLVFYPRKPTRAFIGMLLKNGFAMELDSGFVMSYFKFMVDANHEIYKNPKIKRFYKNSKGSIPYKANLFDMNLCSVMFRDPILEVVKFTDFFALTEPRKYDLKKYKCRKKLKRVSEKYIDDKFEIWQDNAEEIEDFTQKKNEEIAERGLVKNRIGSEDKLNDDFMGALEEFNLGTADGLKIRSHIVDKLNSGELNEKSYYQRALYLMSHFEVIDKQIGEYDESVEVCPYCGADIPDFARSCLKCGLHIREIDFEKHIEDKLKESMGEMINDFADFMKSKYFDDNVSIEEEDDGELKELKIFFNNNLVDFDFDEFLTFYKTCDKNLAIEEIKDMFLDDKLNRAIGSEDEFDTYFLYLIHYFYRYRDDDRYDDAFIKLVQMAILVSNKSTDENSLLYSNPRSLDIYTAIEEMDRLDYSFDVFKLFDDAVATFKISKYNKNHIRVLKELKIIFN